MCTPSDKRQSGVTLPELIIFIVVVSVGLAGVILSLNLSVKNSADPLQPAQAMAIAEALLEEITSKEYCDPALPSAITVSADTSAGSNVISHIADTTGIAVGWQVVGDALRGSSLVTGVTADSLTLSAKPLTDGTGVPLLVAACQHVEASRDLFNNIGDYDGYTQNDFSNISGTIKATGYNVAVSVPAASVTLSGIPATQITVTVTTPGKKTYSLTAYRTAY